MIIFILIIIPNPMTSPELKSKAQYKKYNSVLSSTLNYKETETGFTQDDTRADAQVKP